MGRLKRRNYEEGIMKIVYVELWKNWRESGDE